MRNSQKSQNVSTPRNQEQSATNVIANSSIPVDEAKKESQKSFCLVFRMKHSLKTILIFTLIHACLNSQGKFV